MIQETQRFEIFEEMVRISRKLRAVFDARLRANGLTLARSRTLQCMARSETINQKKLADELDIETSTLVRLIDGLEAQGLIVRREVEGDRRAKQPVLTRKGAALVEIVDRLAVLIGRDVLSGIGEGELKSASAAMRRIADNIEGIALGRRPA
jgi:MarR family transcriptional regulator for hemolysin